MPLMERVVMEMPRSPHSLCTRGALQSAARMEYTAISAVAARPSSRLPLTAWTRVPTSAKCQ